jgi:hypothetical protein
VELKRQKTTIKADAEASSKQEEEEEEEEENEEENEERVATGCCSTSKTEFQCDCLKMEGGVAAACSVQALEVVSLAIQ